MGGLLHSTPVTVSQATNALAFAMFADNAIRRTEERTSGRPHLTRRLAGDAGGRPGGGLANDMWMFLEICWQQNPSKRPSMGEREEMATIC